MVAIYGSSGSSGSSGSGTSSSSSIFISTRLFTFKIAFKISRVHITNFNVTISQKTVKMVNVAKKVLWCKDFGILTPTNSINKILAPFL